MMNDEYKYFLLQNLLKNNFLFLASLKSFGNSWGNSYTKFIKQEIMSSFTSGESNLY